VLGGDPAPPYGKGQAQARIATAPTFQPTALARLPAGPHFTHNQHCRLGSAWRAALVAILPIIATRLVKFYSMAWNQKQKDEEITKVRTNATSQ